MREYSKARLDEKQRLVDQCASLEGEVVSLVHTAPLTWKQIASALRYAHDAEVAKRDVLRLQVNKNSILLRNLQTWVALNPNPQVCVEKHEHTNMLRVVTSYGEALNVVLGHFHPTPTRWVVVGQQISVDDLVDQSQWPQKDRSFWYTAFRDDVADAMAHWRMLQILPQAKTGAGVVSLEDEGHRWGVDLDTHDNGRAVFIKTAHEVMAMLTKNALDAVLASFAQS
ncbi:hypothetical protein DYB32_005799 [Aphanomyces invadans]|uniref:Uncharacterized protein n=1 Tax=Aphanomyces invadans TaxID=157072 RepID=A0A418AWA4_9STRA|nr:hypothetical protein DYB32_005799 [Aphanomyces invadans]